MKRSVSIFKFSYAIIIAGGILFPICFLVMDLNWRSLMSDFPFSLEYYPAFIATATGVLLALVLEQGLSTKREKKSLDSTKNIIRKELVRASR